VHSLLSVVHATTDVVSLYFSYFCHSLLSRC